MTNGVFPPKIWKSVLEKLNTNVVRNINLKQIRQKFNSLRGQHRQFSLLLQHIGSSWDAATGTVTANVEVWKIYLLAHTYSKTIFLIM
ncbi:hypothetical protein L6164_026254 [Bauhinia variegata]|uniref:Uncharacterized protein n=1 Tax=Bauhinia variegata TaxID=167791 RepID=A0ACB9LQC3_BAUVA|nr:hypothetical protein L6164_026254 [Bauhinia variegata]